MQSSAAVVLALSVLASGACYRFEPVTLEAVPEGSTIRALLSQAANDRLRAEYQIEVSGPVDGTVLAANSQDLSLWVPATTVSREFGTRVLYQQVEVPKADVLRVDLRRLDVVKTGLVLAAGTAGLVVVARATFLGAILGGDNGGNGMVESVRSWVLPVVVGWF